MAHVLIKNLTGTGESSASWTRDGGYTQPRLFQVSDYTLGDDRGRPLNILKLNGIPQPGDPHPDTNWGNLVVIGQSISLREPNIYVVTCNYGLPKVTELPPNDGDPTLAVMSVSTTLQEGDTQFDIEGARIKTELVDGEPVYGFVNSVMPTTSVRFERHEENSPGQKAINYVGSLNNAPVFNNDPARTWLCSEISGHSNNGGDSWVVSYGFLRSMKFKQVAGGTIVLQPWDPTIVQLDDKGNPHPDATVSNDGIKTIRVHRATDWAGLNLDLSYIPAR